jgi:hypothetical protein
MDECLKVKFEVEGNNFANMFDSNDQDEANDIVEVMECENEAAVITATDLSPGTIMQQQQQQQQLQLINSEIAQLASDIEAMEQTLTEEGHYGIPEQATYREGFDQLMLNITEQESSFLAEACKLVDRQDIYLSTQFHWLQVRVNVMRQYRDGLKSVRRGTHMFDVTMVASNKRVTLLPANRRMLKEWFDTHADNPYPSEDVKREMAASCGIGYTQINTWFINQRTRHWKKKRALANSATLA